MGSIHSRRRLLQLSSAAIATGVAGCSIIGGPSPEEQVSEYRETLSQYTDPEQAVQHGYQMSVPYIRKDSGNLGFPWVKLGGPERDPEEPNILYYDLLDDGTFELAGVEWFVSTDSTDSAPSLFGRTFDEPTDGETAFIPRHYGLTAWLFNENPEGLFASTHPELTPPSYIDQLDTLWDTFSAFYLNPEQAQEAGYRNTEECIATESGGYGVPYVNTDRVGTTLTEPPVLLYRLTSTWNYQLMGAEWYVDADSTDTPPTMFGGHEFHDAMDAHSPNFEQGSHYGLHVWFFVANPRGLFAPLNPTISCG